MHVYLETTRWHPHQSVHREDVRVPDYMHMHHVHVCVQITSYWAL
jgi:hypothetical protein